MLTHSSDLGSLNQYALFIHKLAHEINYMAINIYQKPFLDGECIIICYDHGFPNPTHTVKASNRAINYTA